MTATPVPGSSRSPLLLCGHDYFGAVMPYVVDATTTDSVAIPADEKVVLHLSNDCSHGTAVHVVPGSALSLTQYLPDQAHAVAAWASSPTGVSTLKLTAASGQVRTLTVRAASGHRSPSRSVP